MGGIFQVLLENLRELIPLKIVLPFQRGVRFRWGKFVDELQPGVHVFIPFLWSIEVVPVVADVLNLNNSSVTTSDRVAVNLSAMVEFQIVDVVAMYTKVQDLSDSLGSTALGHLSEWARERTLEELLSTRAAFRRSLRETMTTRVREWGVKINDVHITDLVVAKQIRLIP